MCIVVAVQLSICYCFPLLIVLLFGLVVDALLELRIVLLVRCESRSDTVGSVPIGKVNLALMLCCSARFWPRSWRIYNCVFTILLMLVLFSLVFWKAHKFLPVNPIVFPFLVLRIKVLTRVFSRQVHKYQTIFAGNGNPVSTW